MFNTPQIETGREVINLIAAIDETKGYWNCLQKFCDIEKNVSLQETVKESSDAVLTELKHEKPIDMTGYTMALTWIFNQYESIEISEETADKLFNMIENLPSGSKVEKTYSDTSDDTEESDDFGSIFGGMNLYEEEAPKNSSKRGNDYTLTDLMKWADKEFCSKKLHPLLINSIFSAAFLNLQAYPSANSRLSRVLSLLMLLKSGYTYQSFHSLDIVIGRDYPMYQSAYENAVNEKTPDYDLWNVIYLQLLKKQADVLYSAIVSVEPDAVPVEKTEECPLCELAQDDEEEECPLCALADEPVEPVKKKPAKPAKPSKSKVKEISLKELHPLQAKIMRMFSKRERIIISEVVKSTKANLNTVKKHLASMVEKGLIEKHGKTKGCWYTKLI